MKRSPLRKVSKKMSSRLREYIKIRNVYLLTIIYCEEKKCLNVASEIHHKKGKIGHLLTDTNYFMAVCRSCHNKIENNRKWAMEMGYSLDRLKK